MVDSLQEALTSFQKSTDILFYEVLDIPLVEYEAKKSLKIAWHSPQGEEVSVLNLLLDKEATVGHALEALAGDAPLIVAEQFGTLESLYPGRIDLGLGRAPGTDGLTARALRRELRLGGLHQASPKALRLRRRARDERRAGRFQTSQSRHLSLALLLIPPSTSIHLYRSDLHFKRDQNPLAAALRAFNASWLP